MLKLVKGCANLKLGGRYQSHRKLKLGKIASEGLWLLMELNIQASLPLVGSWELALARFIRVLALAHSNRRVRHDQTYLPMHSVDGDE